MPPQEIVLDVHAMAQEADDDLRWRYLRDGERHVRAGNRSLLWIPR